MRSLLFLHRKHGTDIPSLPASHSGRCPDVATPGGGSVADMATSPHTDGHCSLGGGIARAMASDASLESRPRPGWVAHASDHRRLKPGSEQEQADLELGLA